MVNSATPRPTVVIVDAVIAASEKLLRARAGRSRHELIVYWAGVEAAGTWLVTTVIAPHAKTTRGSYSTSAQSNAQVVSQLSAHELLLFAQVHTHPGHFVEHSDGDDNGAFMPYENLLSVIVPNYGKDGLLPLLQCGIHRFERDAFRALGPTEIQGSCRIVPTAINFRK